MTAKEIFEELGYKLKPSHRTKCRYEKQTDEHLYQFCFNEKLKIFSKICDYGKTHIKVEELKAINKQVEELGWLGEK